MCTHSNGQQQQYEYGHHGADFGAGRQGRVHLFCSDGRLLQVCTENGSAIPSESEALRHGPEAQRQTDLECVSFDGLSLLLSVLLSVCGRRPFSCH